MQIDSRTLLQIKLPLKILWELDFFRKAVDMQGLFALRVDGSLLWRLPWDCGQGQKRQPQRILHDAAF